MRQRYNGGTDKPRFLVSETYDIVTPESAEIGDFAESGYERKDEPCSLAEVLAHLEPCCELSSWPIRRPEDLSGHEWASTESYIKDWTTGEDITYSIHVKRLDGSPCRPADLFRLFKLAGLIAR